MRIILRIKKNRKNNFYYVVSKNFCIKANSLADLLTRIIPLLPDRFNIVTRGKLKN